jgi:hypothetical protein
MTARDDAATRSHEGSVTISAGAELPRPCWEDRAQVELPCLGAAVDEPAVADVGAPAVAATIPAG